MAEHTCKNCKHYKIEDVCDIGCVDNDKWEYVSGRRKIEFSDKDKEMILRMAGNGCPNTEIADYFGCTDKTIYNHFYEELTRVRAGRKNDLRYYQWARAKQGSDKMLAWLGMNELGQSNKADYTSGGESFNNAPVNIIFNEVKDRSEIESEES